MDSGQVITSVAATLNDPDYVRWSADDLVAFLNEGCLQAVTLQHSVNAERAVVTLAEGTRQEIPADGIGLIEVQRNTPSGRAVRFVNKETMDAAAPLWHGAARASVVREYCYDARERKVFWVYPPAGPDTQVEILYAKRPEEVSTPADPVAGPWDAFPLDPEYEEPVRLWMLYRAYLQDTGASSAQKASGYYKQFNAWFGLDAQGHMNSDPVAES